MQLAPNMDLEGLVICWEHADKKLTMKRYQNICYSTDFSNKKFIKAEAIWERRE